MVHSKWTLDYRQTTWRLTLIKRPFKVDEPVRSLTDSYVKSFAYKAWCLTRGEGIHIVYRAYSQTP